VKNPLDTNVKQVYYLISFTNVKEGSFIFGNLSKFFTTVLTLWKPPQSSVFLKKTHPWKAKRRR